MLLDLISPINRGMAVWLGPLAVSGDEVSVDPASPFFVAQIV